MTFRIMLTVLVTTVTTGGSLAIAQQSTRLPSVVRARGSAARPVDGPTRSVGTSEPSRSHSRLARLEVADRKSEMHPLCP